MLRGLSIIWDKNDVTQFQKISVPVSDKIGHSTLRN